MIPEMSRVLQWGRDQLIAETSWTSSTSESTQALQWGRDQLIAETHAVEVAIVENDPASMGPRSIDRGNAAEAVEGAGRKTRFNGAAIN